MRFDSSDFTPEVIVYRLVISMVAWFIVLWIRDRWKAYMSKKCRRGHKKKYLKIGQWTNVDCKVHGRHTDDDWWSYWGTWICQEPGCNAHGEDCFGTRGRWKVHMGEVVIDEKAMTDPPQERTPKQVVQERRAKEQGLPKPVNVQDAFKLLEDLAVAAKKEWIVISKPVETQPNPPPNQQGGSGEKKET